MSAGGGSDGLKCAGALLLAAVMFLAPARDAAAQPDPTFHVVNRSSQAVRNIYVSTVDASQWGRDWLGSATLAPGQRFRIAPPRDGNCVYDVRVVYANGQSEERRRQNLCQTSEIAFSGPGGASVADFDVVNRSSQAVIQVFVSPAQSDKWGEDRLPGTIAPGARFTVRLPRDGQCQYDVRVVYADKSTDDRRRQNLCATSELAFSGASAGGQAVATANPDFEVLNRSAQTITQLFVSPAQSDKWGDDRLPGTLAPGARFTVRLPRDGQCQYDVRVVYGDKTTEDRRRQNVCQSSELAFAGASGGTPQKPAPSAPGARSFGTGFFVSEAGHAVTNHHVIENCGSLTAVLEGRRYGAQLVRRDARNDLALLRVKTADKVAFARFRATPGIKPGEGVVVAGYPLPSVLDNGLNITVGNVSNLAGLGGNAALIQVTAPVQPGNSGGPLLDMAGNIIGVVVSKLDAMRIAQSTGDIPQNINFAVHGPVARLFLEADGQRIEERSSERELKVADVGDRAREFTFQVECGR
jgi:serine protease Do